MSSRWNNERIRNWSMLPGLQHFGVEGRAKALRRDYDEWQACQLFTRTCINQTSWLVHNQLVWTRLGLGGSHHLPVYDIIYAWPWGLHPNVILSWDSQVGNTEIFGIGFLATLEAHNFLCILTIEVRFEAKLYPSLRAFQTICGTPPACK